MACVSNQAKRKYPNNPYINPIPISLSNNGYISLRLAPATSAREAAIPRVSGKTFDTTLIHVGKAEIAIFAPEKINKLKYTKLLTNITLAVSRLRHPISRPSPQVLKVVIMIVKPRAGRSVRERSSPISRTPQVLYALGHMRPLA